MIVNPDYSGAEAEMADVEAAGRTIGIKALPSGSADGKEWRDVLGAWENETRQAG